MFDIIPNLLTSIITVLFPVFASYKALRTSDPAQLTPWLMYWVVLSLFILVDFWIGWLTYYLPFYAWIRLFVLSYLVLPQVQGAKTLYQSYIHRFFRKYELEIEHSITSMHERAVAAGLGALKKFISYVKENVLGIETKSPPRPTSETDNTYAQNLLSRFNLPSARQGLAAPAGDIYSLLSSALGTISSSSSPSSREAQVENLSRSGTLVPQGITRISEQRKFLTQRKEQMMVLVAALDKQNSDLGTEEVIERDVDRRLAGVQLGESLKTSKSEAEFEEIRSDEPSSQQSPTKSNSWNLWNWSSGASAKATGVDTGAGR
ncbi:uncharacterized protein KY384_005513 [Bacidia gigantensis]|uniref:uncharacterized protein n=1 Tax=Bacidia gigantensis TaxID=2732470 RepID=UPI001D03F42F|nr:uncharacterized protein KY384_005513 [Bacidia gigantensis]KAG8530031.1 hypothetical protein KY384_005513 [Bacidia gigantensis]